MYLPNKQTETTNKAARVIINELLTYLFVDMMMLVLSLTLSKLGHLCKFNQLSHVLHEVKVSEMFTSR